ncbi:MAG: PEP-CTERM sorting domain-containing protein [Planctomycetota bacterium]|nr:MAG: PEP-CTERM sorting domain-containing protein [Planctomycetota bacterium]
MGTCACLRVRGGIRLSRVQHNKGERSTLMKKYLATACALCMGLGVAQASQITVINSEAASFVGVNSNESLGDPSNVVMNWTFTGGFNANNVHISGNLTEVLTGTFASEADIFATLPSGTLDIDQSSTGNYTGTVAVSTDVSIATPVDPAGNVSFEFYESFNDGAGTDQIWDDITIEFQEIGIQNGMVNLGALPSDGSLVTYSGHNVAGGLDFFDFSIGGPGVGAAGSYLNAQTIDPVTGDTIDTEIGLFDSAGVLVAFDDDGQDFALGGLYSMLSFGVDDPLTGSDTTPGADGATLAAGDYTLVVGGYDTNFEDLTIGVSTLADVIAGTSAGDYDLQLSYVPEPASLMLLGFVGMLGLRRRR